MEAHGEEQLSLEVVFDLHDDEAVLLGHALLESQWPDVVFDLPLVERFHAAQIYFSLHIVQLGSAVLQTTLFVVSLQQFFTPGDVHE